MLYGMVVMLLIFSHYIINYIFSNALVETSTLSVTTLYAIVFVTWINKSKYITCMLSYGDFDLNNNTKNTWKKDIWDSYFAFVWGDCFTCLWFCLGKWIHLAFFFWWLFLTWCTYCTYNDDEVASKYKTNKIESKITRHIIQYLICTIILLHVSFTKLYLQAKQIHKNDLVLFQKQRKLNVSGYFLSLPLLLSPRLQYWNYYRFHQRTRMLYHLGSYH